MVGRLVLALALVLVAGAGERPATASEFDACDAEVRTRPQELDSYGCYWRTARRLAAWPEAVRRLDALLAVQPDNHRAKLYLGAVEADRNHDRAEPLYRSAIEGFTAQGDYTGEVYARVSLTMFLTYRERHDEAALELEAAEVAALAAGDDMLIAQTRARRGWQAYHRNDYGQAWVFFRRAYEDVFPDGPNGLQVQLLDGLGATAWATGEVRYSLDCYSRAADILKRKGDPAWEASLRNNILLLSSQPGAPRALTPEEIRGLAREAVDAAVRSGNRQAEATARLYLGQTLPGDEGMAELEAAVRIERELGDPGLFEVLNSLAFKMVSTDPAEIDRALTISDEAIDLAWSRIGPGDRARALSVRATIHRIAGNREMAISTGLAALDAIESVRELQPDHAVRVATFSRWAPEYYKLAHYVLASGDAGTRDRDVSFAVAILERMRARVLLDVLDGAGASEVGDRDSPARSEWTAKLEEISSVQRRLLEPGLTADSRHAALVELEALEQQERVLRDAVARVDREFALLRTPDLVGVADVQEALDADEAVLSFQVDPGLRNPAGYEPTHGWLIVITREGARAYPLPTGPEIGLGVHMFLGLLDRRDGSTAVGAANLYRTLLEEAMRDLPPGIEELVVVPDGILNRVPIGVLRPDRSADPLAARYRISRVPSLTLWLRWRNAERPVPSRNVLALADPELPSPESEDASRRAAGAFAEFLGLGPLPYARDEARDVIRQVGGDSVLAVGPEASEALLDAARPGEFRLLHLAAHAVIDGRHPARSALVLSAGDDDEDGLLQVREIVNLDLDGTVVFLSACSSASGPVVAGEGVLGFARAFFQAGAVAVIGNLWPLRDDEAAAMASDLSRHLSRGKSLGHALQATQARWIRDREPASAWAGLVLVGRSDVVPFEAGPSGLGRGGTVTLLVIATALLVRSVFLWRRRRLHREGEASDG